MSKLEWLETKKPNIEAMLWNLEKREMPSFEMERLANTVQKADKREVEILTKNWSEILRSSNLIPNNVA